MAAEDFLDLDIEQKGIDVELVVFDPGGRKVSLIDYVQGERGVESVVWIAKTPGAYRIEVHSNRPTDSPARYELRFAGVRIATEQHRAVNQAAGLIAEADIELAGPTANPAVAIARYRQAITLLESANQLRMKALVLNKLGRSYNRLSEDEKAIEFHKQALDFARAAQAGDQEAAALAGVGLAYRQQFDYQKSLDYLNQSLQVWQLIQDRRGELDALMITGRAYYLKSEFFQAISVLDQSVELARVLHDHRQEANALSALGMVYYVLGDNEKAADIWLRSLAFFRAGGHQGMEMVLLSKLGSVYSALGDTRQALNYLNLALQLARERGARLDEAGALQTLGRLYRSTGEHRKAIAFLDQSLMLLKDGNYPDSVARANYNLGKIYTDLGEYDEALRHLNPALAWYQSKNDTVNVAVAIRELARAERGRGNLTQALVHSETALNLVEWLRMQAGAPELRASYLAVVQDCFEIRIDVLTRLDQLDPSRGYAAAALQTSERARARSLLETLADAGVDIRRGVDPDLLRRERTITASLSMKASEQARLLATNATESEQAEARKEIRELGAEYQRLEAQIRAASPRYAELMQPQPLNLAEIRNQVIDDQTVLLEYYLGTERSYLWVVTSSSIKSFALPSRQVIEGASRPVYELLVARNRQVKFETAVERRARIVKAEADYSAAATALSRIVLAPVEAEIRGKRLLIVSDGALQYVPFAALPMPNRTAPASYEPLAAFSEIVSLPSASTLAVLRREVGQRKPALKTITVLADPVFSRDDERVTEAVARNRTSPSVVKTVARPLTGFRREFEKSAGESGWEGGGLSMTRVPFTRREADAIAALVPADNRKEQLDFAASLTNATSADLAQYRIVHFATHGFLNSRHPELSGIVLSMVDENGRDQPGFLRAHEIYGLRIPAELVVLSGCRTGLGKEIRGEGLVGLTRAFMHAGAARVLVSLWDVNDEATAELMTRFYRQLLGPEKHSPAGALRAAQLSMAKDPRWSSPYFWAGFSLQGEPR